jgi:hypothetical protein
LYEVKKKEGEKNIYFAPIIHWLSDWEEEEEKKRSEEKYTDVDVMLFYIPLSFLVLLLRTWI